jgi:PTS system fructose-specific IIC component
MMHISEYLEAGQIVLALEADAKDAAIREVAATLKKNGRIRDFDKFVMSIFEREDFSTTGIGHGIAIPHARTEAVSDIVIAFGRSDRGIEFGSLDGKPVHLIFVLGTPRRKNLSRYLSVLARLTRLLERREFRDTLLKATGPEQVISAFKAAET